MEKVTRLTSENGVVVFSKSTCCLCYAVNILFQELGVAPVVYEIDQDPEGREMEKAIMRLGCNAPVPAVFISGKLIGSTNEVMSLHLSETSYGIVFWGELVDHMRCLLGSVSVDSNVQLLHFLTGDEFFGGLIKVYRLGLSSFIGSVVNLLHCIALVKEGKSYHGSRRGAHRT
ncbi:hypothetical protein TEA_008900 [Camellia sinensis var. sinensis]|uniref:Glutaredoxin domain-containing protein n=1 Tax=Camellia sinensis var. sinensis TaxID=542762 RepID=A0A4S4D861_CAMSN|nr:hypothetical protein TEA_008900 [Camellia sinensis var. sinensis]